MWKRKGPQDRCDSFRAILVTSSIGKINHALLRRSCIDSTAASGSALQIGGLPRFPVTYGSQVVRLFQASAIDSCFALIFLDLKEAFYRAVRPLLVPGLDHVQAIVDKLHLPVWAASDIVALWKRPAISHTNMTQHQQSLWTENFSDAWFKLLGQQDLVRTSMGSRPGDSLADAGFYFLFSWVLRSVSATLKLEGWLQPVPWDERMRDNLFPVDCPNCVCWPSDVTWMDDLCLLLRFKTPQLCAHGTSFAAGLLVDCCLRHGMEPNLGPGKTECIVQFKGKGARDSKRAVHSQSPPSLPLGSELWRLMRIRVVPQYKHLGGLIYHAGGLLAEARSRVGQAWSSFRRHSKTVYSNPGVGLSDKCQIFTSVVESTLLYGAGTWPEVSNTVLSVLEHAYADMVRRLLHKSCSWDTFRAKRILAFAGLPDMQTQLHVHRLRFLASFVRVGVQESWALAHQQTGWLALVRSSLQWLWLHTRRQQDTHDWLPAVKGWITLVRTAPHKWKALIRKARSVAIWEARVSDLHQQNLGLAAKQLVSKGASVPPQAARTLEILDRPVEVCGPCGKVFNDKRSWSVHAFKCHGRVRASRQLVTGVSCPSCLRMYASHVRLCNHLHHSTQCARQLRRAGFEAPVQPWQNSRSARQATSGFGPVLELQGPLPPVLEDDGTSGVPVVDQLMGAFRDLWEHRDVQQWDQVLGFYRQIFLSYCASLDDISTALATSQQDLCGLIGEDLPIPHLVLHRQALTWLQANFAASWLLEGETQPLARGLCSYRDALAIWDVLDFQHLPGVQTPTYCQFVSFAAVLSELLPWARETLQGTSLFGIPTCAETGIENFWRTYKAAADISSEPCALYLNFGTPKLDLSSAYSLKPCRNGGHCGKPDSFSLMWL